MIRAASRRAAAALPAPAIVQDARIGPPLARRGAFLARFQADVGNVDLMLRRGLPGGGLRAATEIEAVPPDAPDEAYVAGHTIFAGPYFSHFGHMIAEGIHRLWPALLPGLETAEIVFVSNARRSVITPWMEALLDLFGVTPERVRFNDRLTRYERLVVGQQGRGLATGVLVDGYLDLFPLIDDDPRSGSGPPIYLSRAQQGASGTYLGERLVEQVLREAGFLIVYPEDQPIAGVVRQIVAAPVVVVSEGSAIHNLELAGRIEGRVFLIGRRHGLKNFIPLLDAACAKWAMFRPGNEQFSLDRDAAGRESGTRVCTAIDLPKLVREIASFTGLTLRVPSAEEVRQAMAADLATYLLRPTVGTAATEVELGQTLARLRSLPGLRSALGLAAPRG